MFYQRHLSLIILLLSPQLPVMTHTKEYRREGDLMDGVLTYLLTLSSTENVLQSIKEVLTLHQYFNPFTLFNYISQNNTTILREHLEDFLVENGIGVTDELLRLALHSNGLKEKISYTEFLNYIYPVNAQVLREISTNQIKKYSKTEKTPVNEEVLCCFLMLLDQEIEFIKTFEDLKREQPITLSRERMKRIFRTIKKANEKELGSGSELSAENIITHVQLRSFIKLYHKIPDSEVLDLARRLSMGRQGIIGVDEFEFWMKPWRKARNQDAENPPSQGNSSHNNTSKLSRNLPPRFEQVQEPVKEECFLQFVSGFLEAEKQITDIKSILATKSDFDILGLFKQIDRKSCGVIASEDIELMFAETSNEPTARTSYLINKFSSGRGVLSFSEFAQIFEGTCDDQAFNPRRGSHKPISLCTLNLALEIIRINIQSQIHLHSTLSPLHKGSLRRLFHLINKQSNGFISYQQLKVYLSSHQLPLQMGQLMSILKRFDRNKNGVIVEEDFLRVLKA